jgi:hypothetical protein
LLRQHAPSQLYGLGLRDDVDVVRLASYLAVGMADLYRVRQLNSDRMQ